MRYEEARETLKNLCEKKTPLVFLVGSPGAGKSHLLLELVDTVKQNGYAVIEDYLGTFDGSSCHCDLGPKQIGNLLTSPEFLSERGPVDGPTIMVTHSSPIEILSPEVIERCAVDIADIPVVFLEREHHHRSV